LPGRLRRKLAAGCQAVSGRDEEFHASPGTPGMRGPTPSNGESTQRGLETLSKGLRLETLGKGLGSARDQAREGRQRVEAWGRRFRAMVGLVAAHPGFVPLFGAGFWIGKQMAKKKERRLDKMLAATLVGDIDFTTCDQLIQKPHDSWVHFPEQETLKWFSDLVDKLWYHIDAATHKVGAMMLSDSTHVRPTGLFSWWDATSTSRSWFPRCHLYHPPLTLPFTLPLPLPSPRPAEQMTDAHSPGMWRRRSSTWWHRTYRPKATSLWRCECSRCRTEGCCEPVV
jgi:hypothetical protein